jgi:hypothetical protein
MQDRDRRLPARCGRGFTFVAAAAPQGQQAMRSTAHQIRHANDRAQREPGRAARIVLVGVVLLAALTAIGYWLLSGYFMLD